MDEMISCKLSFDCEALDYNCLCSKNSLFELLGMKWIPEIITILGYHDKLRYKEISTHLENISPTVLSTRLKQLEVKKYITRTEYAESPPKVIYQLSPDGIKIWDKLQILIND